MLEFPEKFKIDVINRYGTEGEIWLNHSNNLVEKYTKKFELENIILLEHLSVNIVMFATSSKWGEVVVKIGSPSSRQEIKIIKQYPENYAPKCYYSNLEDNIMILEKICPGYSLDYLENLEERIKVFCNLSNHLFIPANNTETFLTFDKVFTEYLEFAKESYPLFKDILWMIDIAKNLYEKMQEMNLPKYILHDDLHHKNILKSENGWKAIDPHGIIGEKVIETAQFLRAELKHTNLEKHEINNLISLMSKHYKEDKKLILETLYFYTIGKVIWQIRIKADSEAISYLITVCKTLLKILGLN